MGRKFVGFRVDGELYGKFRGLVEGEGRRVAGEVERFMETCVEASSVNVLVGSAVGEKLWFENCVEKEMRWLQAYLDAECMPTFDVHDPVIALEALLPRIRDEATARKAIELLRKYDDLLLTATLWNLRMRSGESNRQ